MLTEYIISETEMLINKYGTNDPYLICAARGIRVRRMDLNRKLKGYYFYVSRIENIVIDENLPDFFCRILVAHELGHAVLHRSIAMMKDFTELDIPLSCDKEDSTERDANLFAAELLLDDEEVASLLKEHTFFETAQLLGVPAALLDFKFYLMHKKGYALCDMQLAKPDFLKDKTLYPNTGSL